MLSMTVLRLWKIAPSHEELFLERYEQLLGWALRLTDHDPQRAEDLVHDTFVQFVLDRRDIGTISNLESYLYGMLRNTQLSHARRAAHDPHRHLALAEYDSAELGWRALDPTGRLQAQSELRLICRYACARSRTSKAGSVFILRFFHGYYPSEIALILQTTTAAIARWLQIARSEAKLYIADPQALNFICESLEARAASSHSFEESAPADLRPSVEPEHSLDFIRALAAAIFSSRSGDCLTRDQLRRLYCAPSGGEITGATLRHLVTCSVCLDEVNRLLGLPLLASRHPQDTIERDRRRKDEDDDDRGSGGPGFFGRRAIKAAAERGRRRMREVFEHRPKELRVAADGYVLGAHKISSEASELELTLNLAEAPRFIEIFSEQRLRLLLFDVAPPPSGEFEQRKWIALSDGRALEARIDFGPLHPKLNISYRDPLFSVIETLELETESGTSLAPSNQREQSGTPPDRGRRLTLIAWLWSPLRRFFTPNFWLRPGAVAAAVSLSLVVALFLFKQSVFEVAPTARGLLSQASVAERSLVATPEQAAHRVLDFEERLPAEARARAPRRIEIWQTLSPGAASMTKARRLYDENNRLLAGEWVRPDGGRIIHRAETDRSAIRDPQSAIGNAEISLQASDLWLLEPSPSSFSTLIHREEAGDPQTTIEEQPETYTINYRRAALEASSESGANDTRPRLIKASLKLRKSDLRATEQTLLVRYGGEEREYRYTEARYERLPARALAPAVFEPDPELLSDAATRRRGERAIISLSPSPPASPSFPVASVEFEVETAYLLNQVKANLGEEVKLERTPEGSLRIEGIIETAERKAEILQALAPVIDHPAVKVEVLTVAEALQRQPSAPPGQVITSRIEVRQGALPVESDLRRYFIARGAPGERLDEEIRQLSNRLIARARQAQLHARAMKRLIERFAPEALSRLTEQAKAKRLAMIREHALGFEQETLRLREELAAIFFRGAPSERPSDQVEIRGETDLAMAVGRLCDLGAAHEQAIYSSFSISADGAMTSVIKTPQFWQSLRSAEKLASQIAVSGRQ